MRKHIESELKPDNHRVEGFSDAVFAIVVTIMVLEIRVPDTPSPTTAARCSSLAPTLVRTR